MNYISISVLQSVLFCAVMRSDPPTVCVFLYVAHRNFPLEMVCKSIMFLVRFFVKFKNNMILDNKWGNWSKIFNIC